MPEVVLTFLKPCQSLLMQEKEVQLVMRESEMVFHMT